MVNQLKRIFPYLLVFLLCLTVLSLSYFDVLISPSKYLLGGSGDGIKNIYVFIWHIIYDPDFFQTNSMNYPFGESIFYVDAQPFFSLPLKLLNSIIDGDVFSWLAVLNLLVLLSIPFSSTIFYKVLRKLEVPLLPAVFLSVGIIINAPQMDRIGGHHGLSYMWVLLIGIWLLIKYVESKNNNFLIILATVILIGFLIHPYQGLILAGLSILVILINNTNSLNSEEVKKTGISVLFIIIPVFLFLIINKAFDNHQNRVSNPYGFFEYVSSLKGLFTPLYLSDTSSLSFLEVGKFGSGEDKNYLGLSGIFFLVVILYAFFKQPGLIKKLKPLLIASFILLVFSFGIPFIWKMKHIPEFIPFLKSFRALGRFAWPFYFISALTAIVIIINWKKVPKQISSTLLIILGIVSCWEGHKSLKVSIDNIKKSDVFYDISPHSLLENGSLIPQAILPLPYYNIGSDNYTAQGTQSSIFNSFVFSLNTGIPLISHLGARQSLQEAKDLMGLLGRYEFPKTISKDLFSEAPILLLKTGELSNEQEVLLFDQGKKFSYSDTLKSLPISTLFHDLKIFEPTHSVFKNSFDDNKSSITYKGEGSLSLSKEGFHLIQKINKDVLSTGSYFLEFWVFSGGKNCGEGRVNNCMVVIEEYQNIEKLWIKHRAINDSYIFNKDWTFVQIPFEITNANSNKAIQLSGEDYSGVQVIIDELAIRKQ